MQRRQPLPSATTGAPVDLGEPIQAKRPVSILRRLDLTTACTVRTISTHVVSRTHRNTDKLMNAWTQTPTKWYPLPLAVGALLLVAIQYRKKKRAAEILVDEHGVEVVKLRGPWQVDPFFLVPPFLQFSQRCRFT